MILHNQGRAGDGGADRGGVDFCAARALRNAQENGAVFEIEIASSFVETENRIGTQPRDGQIGKRQFTARLQTGAHGGAIADGVINRCRARRRLRREQLHLFDNLGDFCFFQLRAGDNVKTSDRDAGDDGPTPKR